MTTLRRWMFGIAAFQTLSTLVGFVELIIRPQWFAPMLDGSPFEEHNVPAAVLLGVVVGGPQWAALVVHRRHPQWLDLGHTIAGTVMLGWIAGQCLVIDSFTFPHALWGGLGVVQLLLVLVHLGVLRPRSPSAPSP